MLNLAQLAAKIGADYRGSLIEFQGASIDTRTLLPGQLFFAIRAERDGHAFAEEALQKRAAALVVDHPLPLNIPQLIVKDTTLALGEMAQIWRQQFSIPVLALTGSCGKTTTKEMLAHILKECGPVLATEGNLNNALGVPLTLFRLNSTYAYAVLEMGTNSPGEIAYIAQMAVPTVALITNIGASHLEKLHSFEGVSEEKSDLFSALALEGVALLNIDEPYASSWLKKIAGRRCLSYGSQATADIRFDQVRYAEKGGVTFQLHLPQEPPFPVTLHLSGQHIVLNAVAAAAAAYAVGANARQIAAGLLKLKSVSGRFRRIPLKNGGCLIDDTYNASVGAVHNAIATLSAFEGQKVFVMTSMNELGGQAAHYHAELGKKLHQAGFNWVGLYGDQENLKVVMQGCSEAHYFNDKKALICALKPWCQSDTMILIKGAHSYKMEEVVQGLLEGESECAT